MSTLSCVDTGKFIQRVGGVKSQNPTTPDTVRLDGFLWGVFCRGGGVRKLDLYSIYVRSGMVFRAFAEFESAVNEEGRKLIAILVGGDGELRKFVAEGVLLTGSFERERARK